MCLILWSCWCKSEGWEVKWARSRSRRNQSCDTARSWLDYKECGLYISNSIPKRQTALLPRHKLYSSVQNRVWPWHMRLPNRSLVRVILHTTLWVLPSPFLQLSTHSLFSISLSNEAIFGLSHLFVTLLLLNSNEKVMEIKKCHLPPTCSIQVSYHDPLWYYAHSGLQLSSVCLLLTPYTLYWLFTRGW